MTEPSLTPWAGGVIHSSVKKITAIIPTLTLAVLMEGVLVAQEASQSEVMHAQASQATIDSAVEAVEALGNAVVQGRYEVAVERMNPKWKARYAKRAGGIEKLEKALKSVPAEMVKQGIEMVSFKPQGKPIAYAVSPTSVEVQSTGGGGGEKSTQTRLVNTQWMILVPTVTHFRITRQDGAGNAETADIESISYQVAISDRGKNEWTFIDGAGLTVNDLRSVFISLPQDLDLPTVGKRKKE